MADTIYTDYASPPVKAAWLNDVNAAIYRAIGTGVNGTAPATPAAVLANLGLSGNAGSSLIGYFPAGTGAVATTIQAKLRERVSVFDFQNDGGSQVAVYPQNATTGLQKAINYCATNNKELDWCGQTFLADNLTIPAVGSPWDYGSGMVIWKGNGARIIKNSSADNSYLVAPYNWINNVTSGQGKFEIDNLIFDGNNIAQDVFVHMNYYADMDRVIILNATRYGLRLTAKTKNTSAIVGSLAENKFNRLRIKLCADEGFHQEDPSGVITDCTMSNCNINDNYNRNVTLVQAAGWQIWGNHVYNPTNAAANESFYIQQAWGAQIFGNVFEGNAGNTYALALVGGFGQFVLGPNSYYNRVRCDFQGSNTQVVFQGGNFVSANAWIYANADDITKCIVTVGVSFEATDPYQSLNGSSSATRHISDGDIIAGTNLLHTGRQFPSSGFTIQYDDRMIYQESSATLDNDCPNEVRTTAVLAADRIFTLPAASLGQRRIRVLRSSSATGAFNLLVKNPAAATIATIATAGFWVEVASDGTNWIQVAAGSQT